MGSRWEYRLNGALILRIFRFKKAGFIPTAIIDWYSRYILVWEIDDTLEISFVLETCRTALGDPKPLIMNSDQGSL